MHDLVTLAALTDGTELKKAVLLVVGNLLAAWLALQAFRHFVKDDWGGLIRMSVGAVFVAGFVYFPDQMTTVLGSLWDTIKD